MSNLQLVDGGSELIDATKAIKQLHLAMVMDKALLNPLILDKIMKKLDFFQLKVCRLVNSRWNHLSMESLYDDPSNLQFTFNYADSLNDFVTHHLYNPKRMTLAAHNDLFKYSHPLLRCSNYTFNNVTNLNAPTLQSFFKNFGPSLRALELIFRPCPVPMSHFNYDNLMDDPINFDQRQKMSFLFMLNYQAPSIETLNLVNLDHYLKLTPQDHLHLPCLTTLKCVALSATRDRSIIHRILLAAPNLTSMRGFNLEDDLNILMDLKKISVVKEFDWLPMDKVDNLKRFLTQPTTVEQIKFYMVSHQRQNCAQLYAQLLEQNKTTIRSLFLGDLCSNFQIKLPILNQLELLTLGFSFAENCIPFGTDLNTTFPNLKVLDCSRMITDFDRNFALYFPANSFHGNLSTVTTIYVCECTPLWMKKLQDLCPNFKHVRAHVSGTDGQMLTKIFGFWKHLESLEVMIGIGFLPMQDFDSIFTGFSNGICQRLRTMPLKWNKQEENYDLMRIKPSLNNLKGLKDLSIVMTMNTLRSFDLFRLPMSGVSGFYSFQRLTNCQVSIKLDSKVVGIQDQKKFKATWESFATIKYI